MTTDAAIKFTPIAHFTYTESANENNLSTPETIDNYSGLLLKVTDQLLP